jgi:hypothetical protein
VEDWEAKQANGDYAFGLESHSLFVGVKVRDDGMEEVSGIRYQASGVQ